VKRSLASGSERSCRHSAALGRAFRCLLPSRRGVCTNHANGAGIDAEVSKIMTLTHAKGMAVAVIDHRQGPAMSTPTASVTPREIR